MSTSSLVGIALVLLGLLEVVVLVLGAVIKRKPILIPAGIFSGAVTAALGVAIYLGKIPLN